MPDTPKKPHLERRRHARRATDLPPVGHNWLVTLIVRNPVTVGMTLALLVASVALVLVLSAQVGIRDQQDKLRDFQIATQHNRAQTVGQFCGAINANAKLINRQTDYLKVILVNGVRSSRAFESTFRKLGLPSYAERLATATRQAAGLEKRKVPALDCAGFIREATKVPPQP